MSAFHRACIAAAAASLGLLSACGTSPQMLDTAAAEPLHEHVQAARAAMDQGDAGAARAALTAFRNEVRELSDAADLNADDAKILVAYADRIDSAIPQPALDVSPDPVEPVFVPPLQIGIDAGKGEKAGKDKPEKNAPRKDKGKDKDKGRIDRELRDIQTDPAAPAPSIPNPVDPAPEEPAPVDPAPEEPTPDEPVPDDPAPDDPAPDDPAPDDPAPDDGTPTDDGGTTS